MASDRFINPGTNPACLAGGFGMWTGLNRTEDVGASSNTYDADMDNLDGRNTQANQIILTSRVVLRVVVKPLTTQQEVRLRCYLLGPQCPLVEDLQP